MYLCMEPGALHVLHDVFPPSLLGDDKEATLLLIAKANTKVYSYNAFNETFVYWVPIKQARKFVSTQDREIVVSQLNTSCF